MKIIVNTKEIQTVLKNLLKITSNKSSNPMLSNIKLTVTDKVELTTTDFTVTANIKLKDVQIIEPGSIVITKDTIKLISKLTDNRMIITDHEVNSGNRNVKYTGFDAKLYPMHENKNYNIHAFTLSKDKMFDVQSITYACGDLNVNPTMSALNIRGIMVSACDRHRLAIKMLEYNNYTKDLNIPSYAIDYVITCTDKQYNGDYAFYVSDDDKYIKIIFENITFEVRLIDGVYPDTKKIIPQYFKTEARVNKDEIFEELKLLRDVTDKRKLVQIDVTADKIKLLAKTGDKQNILISELNAITTGDDIFIGANINYILDALKNNNNEYVTFRFPGKNSPFMIDDDTLILPYRINRTDVA
jgi:DNA polymerase-3 subunit beta